MQITHQRSYKMVWSRKEFGEYVMTALPPPKGEFLGQLFQKKDGSYLPDDVLTLVKLFKDPFPSETQGTIFPITPTDEVVSFELQERLRPWVEKTRMAFWGQKTPPFNSLEEAWSWLKGEEEKDRENYKVSEEEIKKAEELISNWLKEGIFAGITLKTCETLPFPGENGWVRRVIAFPQSTLHRLKAEIAHVAKGTGLSELVILTHLLIGSSCKTSGIRITETLHSIEETGLNRSVTVNITRPITVEDCRKIANEVQKHLGYSGHLFTEKQTRTYLLVQEMGGMPPSGKGEGRKKFCQRALEEYNRRFPDDPYGDWRDLKKVYLNAVKKVEEMGLK